MNPKELAAQAKLKVEKARSRSSVVDVAVRSFKRFSEDDGGPYAASLTYYIFFSIFPLLLFSASVLGYLTFGNEALRSDLINKGVDAIPVIRDALKPGGLDFIQERRGTLALTGFAMTLYAGTGAVLALQHALNRIHRVQDEGTFIQKRVRAVKWLTIIGGAGVLSLGVSTGGSLIASATGGGDIVILLVSSAGGIAISFLVFVSAFTVLPQTHIGWREAVPGALIAAVAFEILKIGGTWYLARGETARNDTFGTFAASAALLVAAYLISQVSLLSAEVNAALAERRATRQSLSERVDRLDDRPEQEGTG